MKVNEIFGPTIQGEGKSIGKQVLFLRLAICNLHCVWCDSKHSWDWSHYDKTKEIHQMTVSQVVDALEERRLRSLVISGGEPLLQQKQIIELLRVLKPLGYWVEIETNGTIIPNDTLLQLVDQINCSPKLSNCGDTQQLRIRDDALMVLCQSDKVYFKFVVSTDQDMIEVDQYINRFNLDRSRIYLMPLGQTEEQLLSSQQYVKLLSDKYHLQFSPRLHITLFGARRAV